MFLFLAILGIGFPFLFFTTHHLGITSKGRSKLWGSPAPSTTNSMPGETRQETDPLIFYPLKLSFSNNRPMVLRGFFRWKFPKN